MSDTLAHRLATSLASPDGLARRGGSFSICPLYVEALARAGRLDYARLVLQKMFTYANHLGLYSQDGPSEQLSSFLQASTYLALISAATNLDRQLS